MISSHVHRQCRMRHSHSVCDSVRYTRFALLHCSISYLITAINKLNRMERPAFNSKPIDKTQLYIQSIRRPGAGIRADPDESLRVWALLPSLFATQIRPSENMTSPTKPKVHNIGLLHCRRKMTKPRPHLAGTEHFLKFGLFWDMRTHRQTDIQTR